jgi:Spx/MgsR family transcriptional regulator
MTVTVYGIPNCDTVKKARKWLDTQGIDYAFHDYKKAGVDRSSLESWVQDKGWEVLLNKRGTTFRKLDDADKADIDDVKAVALMAEHTSMIKRPVVEHKAGLLVGFNPEEWKTALG